jgi:hypothetical protein
MRKGAFVACKGVLGRRASAFSNTMRDVYATGEIIPSLIVHIGNHVWFSFYIFLFNRYTQVADEALRGPGNAQSARMIATIVFASDVNTTSSVRSLATTGHDIKNKCVLHLV